MIPSTEIALRPPRPKVSLPPPPPLPPRDRRRGQAENPPYAACACACMTSSRAIGRSVVHCGGGGGVCVACAGRVDSMLSSAYITDIYLDGHVVRISTSVCLLWDSTTSAERESQGDGSIRQQIPMPVVGAVPLCNGKKRHVVKKWLKPARHPLERRTSRFFSHPSVPSVGVGSQFAKASPCTKSVHTIRP